MVAPHAVTPFALSPVSPGASATTIPVVPAALPRCAPVYRDADAVVDALRPAHPVQCLRPHALHAAAGRFLDTFPGRVLYAVKCNHDPAVIAALAAGGITQFDTASLEEIRLVRGLVPTADCHFMHPIKPRPAIREAVRDHGVSTFSLDCLAELEKILEEAAAVGGRPDALTLCVRLALPKGDAVFDLSGKFGAEHIDSIDLLQRVAAAGARVGLTFHVGSQCLDPRAYHRAILEAGAVARAANVAVSVLDVGGGFPVRYEGALPPPLDAFVLAIRQAVDAAFETPPELWCEPGRALVSGGQSIVVQVTQRRGTDLFLNDGIYGTLADLQFAGLRSPLRLIRAGGAPVDRSSTAAFRLFGPTCDSLDVMRGTWTLPDAVAEGDWIEVCQAGAYSNVLRTGFNGFVETSMVVVADAPLWERTQP